MITSALLLSFAIFSCSSDSDNNNTPDNCEEAQAATAAASVAFDNATDSNYADKCDDYKNALQDEIDICGDADGALQDIIDDLGDCFPSVGFESYLSKPYVVELVDAHQTTSEPISRPT